MKPDLWTDAFFDAMRLAGDPPADAAIDAIFTHGEIAAVNGLLDGLTRNDGIPSADLPSEVRDYLSASATFPPFDPAAVAAAQDLFARHGPEILTALGFYSLPTSYAAAKGVEVLYRTGYIGKRPMRRVFETVQLVVDVLSPGGLAPEGRGVRTAQKVRLMHAAIRRLLTHDPARPWDASLGVPINQEDLAGTLMAFSLLVLEGLARLDITLSPTEREGYLGTWTGVGRILGVREELLPGSADEARELAMRIYRRQVESSDAGRALLAALLDGYDELVPAGSLTGAPRSIVHHFLDAEPLTGRNIARMLGLEDELLGDSLARAAAVGIDEIEALAQAGVPIPVAQTARELGVATTQAILRLDRGGSRAPFHVPEDLQDRWWSRSQGADALPDQAPDATALGDRVAAALAHRGEDLASVVAFDAAPRWNTVGRWRDLLFASWPLPASAIRPLVPSELDLDLFEGQAWITLVPMRMEDVRWANTPEVTSTPTLTELNLRTYVRRGDRRGVYFLSIDLDSAWIQFAGSTFLDLPATGARMTFERQGDVVRFDCERTQAGAPPARLTCSYHVTGAPADLVEGTLPAFLLERFSMFFARGGKVIRGDIAHEPWKVSPVEATITANTVAAAAGLATPEGAPHLLYTEGSDTVVMPLVEDG